MSEAKGARRSLAAESARRKEGVPWTQRHFNIGFGPVTGLELAKAGAGALLALAGLYGYLALVTATVGWS